MCKIGLDIDGVLADFIYQYKNYYGEFVVNEWNFDPHISKRLREQSINKEFWLNIPVLTHPSKITFDPHCYITSRGIPVEWTSEWLRINGFPDVPVYSIGFGQSKINLIKETGIDILIDDHIINHEDALSIADSFLFDAEHNQSYITNKRLYTLEHFNCGCD